MLSVYYSLTPWQHFQNIAFRQKRHIYLSQTFHGEHIHFLWKQKFYESMSTTSDCSKLLLIKYYFIDFTGKYFMMIFLDCQRQTVSSWSPYEFITNKKCFRNIYAPPGAKFKITTYMYKAWLQPLHQVWYWSSEGVKRYWADNTLGSKEWFDLDLWTCDLKINRDHLLIEGNPCTKFGIDQVKGSKGQGHTEFMDVHDTLYMYGTMVIHSHRMTMWKYKKPLAHNAMSQTL